MCTTCASNVTTKMPNLKWKTRLKQLLGSLPLAFVLPKMADSDIFVRLHLVILSNLWFLIKKEEKKKISTKFFDHNLGSAFMNNWLDVWRTKSRARSPAKIYFDGSTFTPSKKMARFVRCRNIFRMTKTLQANLILPAAVETKSRLK